MTKETLKGLGLTDEQVTKVWEQFDGKYIPKTRFDELNERMKTAEQGVKDRDAQLETLKKATGDTQALTKQIEDLQLENKNKDEAHAAELKTVKIENALNSALTGAKARNAETVKPLLKAFMEKAELDEAGTIKGLEAEIKKLTGDKSTSFLFDAETPKPKGFVPGEGKTGAEATDPFLVGFGE
jgi:hypothetical protein